MPEPTPEPHRPTRPSRIPLALKLVYTAFVAVLVPNYLRDYGPTNFLYFCDVALLMTVVAVWLESSLLSSMAAVGILLPQSIWMVDFLGSAVGYPIVGLTGYMFNPDLPLFTRGLSFFHFWLPILLVWLVWRLGYDRRALVAWTLLAWVLISVCYFLMPAPPAPEDNKNLPVNINYVYGFNDKAPQSAMPPLAYFFLVAVLLPVAVYWPTHLILKWLFPRPPANAW